jgi:hypothetical protein
VTAWEPSHARQWLPSFCTSVHTQYTSCCCWLTAMGFVVGLLRNTRLPLTLFTRSHNGLERENAANDTRNEELLHVRQMLLRSAFRCVTLL